MLLSSHVSKYSLQEIGMTVSQKVCCVERCPVVNDLFIKAPGVSPSVYVPHKRTLATFRIAE